MTCHKDSGKGGKITVEGRALNPDDITTAKMKAKPDEKFYGYIADGFPDDGMPAFKDKLKKEEIEAIIKHIRTLQGS
jgi:mono/diheme cytochrome c family protein